MKLASDDWRKMKEAAKKAGVDTKGFDEGFSSKLTDLIKKLNDLQKLKKEVAAEMKTVQKTATSYKMMKIEMEPKYKAGTDARKALDKMGKWCEDLEQWCLRSIRQT